MRMITDSLLDLYNPSTMASFPAKLALLFLVSVLLGGVCVAQRSANLLQNPDGSGGMTSWRPDGEANVERLANGNVCFVVRNGGHFDQDVELPQQSDGKYVLLIGHGASERINSDPSITGLPYLYGYMMEKGRADRREIRSYLQGQQLLGRSVVHDEWVKMWGIFKVPEGTTTIRFFLNQAERSGDPHNGSLARFDNLGLYLFATKDEAEAFAFQYQ